MAGIKRLVSTATLKTARLREAQQKHLPVYFHYDSGFDALMILIVPPETETVVHYLDENVALLYEPHTLEIVGIQVEDFESSFVPAHDGVRRVWRLSDAAEGKLEDMGDLILAIEARKPQIVREVISASRSVLGPPGEELAAALSAA